MLLYHLVHPRPATTRVEHIQIHGGTPSKERGTVGTRDPAIWAHIIRLTDGSIYAALLKSDILSHRPTEEETIRHFAEHIDAYGSPWSCIRKPQD